MKNLLIVVTLVSAVLSQNCMPFGVRVQYGEQLVNSSSTEKLVVMFNTEQVCNDSFMRIVGNQGFNRISCQNTKVVGSVNMSFFLTYVHICSVNREIEYFDDFYYNVYGWDSFAQGDPTPGLAVWVKLNIIDPKNTVDQVNILLMADWGIIYEAGYTPITEDLRQTLTQRNVDLIIINGDVAYDLDSANGTRYTNFLKMSQEFLSTVPFILIPGNHENLSNDDKLLYKTTFKVYGIDVKLTSGFQFADLYFTLFDPFNFVYFKEETINSLDALTSQLAIGKETGLFMIPVSHYPLICSGEALFCQDRLLRMYPYFHAMIDAGSCLYLGAHTHDYERTYPYFKNQSFGVIQSPYEEGKQYLVSIIEGVAGSNTSLIMEMTDLNEYTAKYTVNQTGFGILTSNSQEKVKYEHFSTKQGWMDSMTIKKKAKYEDKKEEKHMRAEQS